MRTGITGLTYDQEIALAFVIAMMIPMLMIVYFNITLYLKKYDNKKD